MKIYAISIVLLTLFFICFAAWAHITNNKMKFYDDPDLMKQEVKRFIPIGISIEQAKNIMEQNDFKCEYREKSTFSERRYDYTVPGSIIKTTYKNVDYIYCDISKGFFIVERRWLIFIVHENRTVTQVSVTTGLIGP